MTHRPLTEEEYAIAGVPTDVCTSCRRYRSHNEYRWVYYRDNGTPKVLCESCFIRKSERGTLADAAVFVSPAAAASEKLESAYNVPGLPQIAPELVTKAFTDFRDLSPAQIRGMAVEIPLRAAPGHQLEWFGPVRWYTVLTCLAWLREIETLSLPYLFRRWAKLDSFLVDELPGIDHEPWRQRVAALAQTEFLFRYSVLLSDAVTKAHEKADSKKNADGKRKVFAEIKAATCKHEPPVSLNGAADELQRFVEYIDAQVARL